ncbi:MAG: hypothetical protein AAGB51_13060 [Planctomycetota bacterium]
MDREPKISPNLTGHALNLPEDRRRTARQPEAGTARGTITCPRGNTKLTVLELRDSCPGGLGVRAAVPAEIGSVVDIFPFAQPIPMTHAEVIRCEPDPEGGYRLGLRRRVIAAQAG